MIIFLKYILICTSAAVKYLSLLFPDARYYNITMLLRLVYAINWKRASFANPTIDILSWMQAKQIEALIHHWLYL